MNSHEYAQKIKQLAEFLLSKPEFETPWDDNTAYTGMYYWGSKENFLGAVRALVSGKKDWRKEDLIFFPAGTDMLRLQISRSSVCRKVQEEKWECEPLLSEDEEATVGV